MKDWFRRKTWTETDQKEFFSKLGRARKSSRVQYLRIQAIELIETGDKKLLIVAETLLNKILVDYTDDRTERSLVFNSLGKIYKICKDWDKALYYYKKSLDYEKVFPNVITSSYLDFSEIVVRIEKTDLYDEVENFLHEKIKWKTFRFPIENYIMYSVLSVISKFNGNVEQSKIFANLAEKNAIIKTNTLWNVKKDKIGIVKERIKWLDKLVKRI